MADIRPVKLPNTFHNPTTCEFIQIAIRNCLQSDHACPKNVDVNLPTFLLDVLSSNGIDP